MWSGLLLKKRVVKVGILLERNAGHDVVVEVVMALKRRGEEEVRENVCNV